MFFFFFFQAEDGIRDKLVTGVQTCALPISALRSGPAVFALDGAGGKVAPAEWCLARVVSRRMREIAFIIRDSENLQIGPAHLSGCLDQTLAQPDHLPRQLGLHTGDSCTRTSGVSMAVGLTWRSAPRQTLIANTHMAQTRRTNTPQTAASR